MSIDHLKAGQEGATTLASLNLQIEGHQKLFEAAVISNNQNSQTQIREHLHTLLDARLDLVVSTFIHLRTHAEQQQRKGNEE